MPQNAIYSSEALLHDVNKFVDSGVGAGASLKPSDCHWKSLTGNFPGRSGIKNKMKVRFVHNWDKNGCLCSVLFLMSSGSF